MTSEPDVQTTGPGEEIVRATPTRSEIREAAIEKWRADMLGAVSVKRMAGLGAAYVVLMIASLMLLQPWPIALLAVMAVLTALGWFLLVRIQRRNATYRTLAELTPLLDLSVARGQIAILRAQFGNLLATMSNPNATADQHRENLARVAASALPLMNRGGITEENATVAGYPEWPEIDRTVMPGQEQDRLSVHLHRIDASISRLERTLESEDVVIEETVARMAGEIVPPARSLAHVMSGG